METTMNIHHVLDVRLVEGLFRCDGQVKATKDLLVTTAGGGTFKLFCFMEEGDQSVARSCGTCDEMIDGICHDPRRDEICEDHSHYHRSANKIGEW